MSKIDQEKLDALFESAHVSVLRELHNGVKNNIDQRDVAKNIKSIFKRLYWNGVSDAAPFDVMSSDVQTVDKSITNIPSEVELALQLNRPLLKMKHGSFELEIGKVSHILGQPYGDWLWIVQVHTTSEVIFFKYDHDTGVCNYSSSFGTDQSMSFAKQMVEIITNQ